MANEEPRLLTVAEVARRLGVSRRSVYKLAAEGRLPAAVNLVGGAKWVSSQFDRWMEAGCPAADVFKHMRSRSEKGVGRRGRARGTSLSVKD